jgi:TolB-like protein
MRFRSIFAAVLGILTLAVASARGDETAPPAPVQPTPVPPMFTHPVAASAAPVCDVYLTPFMVIGNDNTLDWVGKAVQQNLLTDLARAKLHPLGADKAITNASDAQAAAKAAGAKFLISGSYQVADQQVRFNGQVIDAATGNVVGGISTTGAIRDLFKMEDALSSQAIQQVGPLVAGNNNPSPAPMAAPAAPAPAGAPPVIVQIVQPPQAPAGPAVTTKYQGSALEQYVSSNRSPSTDYSQSALDAGGAGGENFAATPGNSYNADSGNNGLFGGNGYSGFGFGYGFGLFYPLPPYGRYGYGTDGHRSHRSGDTPQH